MSAPDDRLARLAPGQLTAVYQELILDHYRRPRNKGPLEGADVTVAIRNPLCGDEIELRLAFDAAEPARVREARFGGQGCSISIASASMMTELARGRTPAELAALRDRFTAMLHGDADAGRDPALGEMRALQGVSRLPVRHRCALLPWTALDEALAKRG